MTATPDGPTLVRLTVAKTVANTALRWIPPFLPTLERAFGASTAQLTTVLGLGEIAGLSTAAVGGQLDKGRERTIMIAALLAVATSSAIALVGSFTSFAIAFTLLIIGVANFTVAGHAWISHRVTYRWRARSIGLLETSWAIALLLGGPLMAFLITQFGWRGPFVFTAVSAVGAAVLIATTLPKALPRESSETNAVTVSQRITGKAWLVLLGSALMATSGLSVFVVSGSWLDAAFGVSTGGLGTIVMGIGAFELIASSSTAAFADRIGKMRSTLGGLVVLAIGLIIMASAGDQLIIGVIGLFLLLLGFEYGFVTSLSLVSEAMPGARGRTLATGHAVGTVCRGSGVVISGWLFDRNGINATIIMSAAAATISFTLFLLSRRSN